MSRRKSPCETKSRRVVRGEHVVELGEERQGCTEGQPAVEILTLVAIAKSEADDGEQGEQCEDGEGDR